LEWLQPAGAGSAGHDAPSLWRESSIHPMQFPARQIHGAVKRIEAKG
jgi:hypothetical protein